MAVRMESYIERDFNLGVNFEKSGLRKKKLMPNEFLLGPQHLPRPLSNKKPMLKVQLV